MITELSDLVHTDEWEDFSTADAAACREAVAPGRFMTMRRAACAVPEKSAKLGRLRELVDKAADAGLKVVVFSYFRDVLAAVGGAVGSPVHGPISGDLPPDRRQTRSPRPARTGWVRCGACGCTACSRLTAWTSGCWRS